MNNLEGLVEKLKKLDYRDIEIKAPLQICESCEKSKGDVILTLNPFAHDVHNEEYWEFLCEDCYGQACADI